MERGTGRGVPDFVSPALRELHAHHIQPFGDQQEQTFHQGISKVRVVVTLFAQQVSVEGKDGDLSERARLEMARSGTEKGRPAEEVAFMKRLDSEGMVRRGLLDRDGTGRDVEELSGLIALPEDKLSRIKMGFDTQFHQLRGRPRIKLLEKSVRGYDPGDFSTPIEFGFRKRVSHGYTSYTSPVIVHVTSQATFRFPTVAARNDLLSCDRQETL